MKKTSLMIVMALAGTVPIAANASFDDATIEVVDIDHDRSSDVTNRIELPDHDRDHDKDHDKYDDKYHDKDHDKDHALSLKFLLASDFSPYANHTRATLFHYLQRHHIPIRFTDASKANGRLDT